LASQPLFSQKHTTAESTAPKARTAYLDGRTYLRQGDAPRALRAFEQALREDSTCSSKRTCYGQKHTFDNDHWEQAALGYEKVMRLNPNFHPSVPFNLALCMWRQDKFMEAYAHIETFLQSGVKNADMLYRAKRLAENCLFAAEAVKNPVPFSPKSLGTGINSPADEYLPALTADGNTMIFTRRDGYDENFYTSTRQPDGSWSLAGASHMA
jgi:tetratricopeptide (TPR) repeat protein